MQREKGRADGRQPPGPQSEEHERRVAHSGQRADQASRDRHQQAFARQKPRDLPGAKAQGQEQPHVFGALFDPQAEQEHDEHHRRGNHEEAEGQEEHAEGRRAGRGFQGLVLDRPEDEPLRHRVEIELLGKRLGRGLRRIPAAGRIRSAVVCPKRLAHSRRPVASETNALGVAPYLVQYLSSSGLIRPRWISKGRSQSSIVVLSVRPRTVGVRPLSAAAPSSFTIAAKLRSTERS